MSTPIPPLSVDTAAEIARSTPGITNREPGFANTYRAGTDSPGGMLMASLPALGVGGLSLLMLYRKHLQDQQEQEEQKKLKLASWQDIKAQLPGIHTKDMLLGGALGGGAGLVYDALAKKPEGKSRLRTALKRILTGAAIGAGGANLVGDRARRYLTNTKIPFGYGTDSIMPKSLRQFWDAAVLDKPSFDSKALDQLVKDNPGSVADRAALDTMLDARRELNRRSFGVHSSNPATDVWQKNKGEKGPDYYSLNEKRKDYLKYLTTLFTPSGKPPVDASVIFKDPGKMINKGNTSKNDWANTGLFGSDSLLGSQQVSVMPTGTPVMPSYKGRVLDRYDFTATQEDKKHFWDSVLSGDIFRSQWRKATPDVEGDYKNNNASRAMSTAQRMLVDNLLTEEHPWISQSFNMTPDPKGNYAMQLTQESGAPAGDKLPPAPSK
jgi:hypothetical protein